MENLGLFIKKKFQRFGVNCSLFTKQVRSVKQNLIAVISRKVIFRTFNGIRQKRCLSGRLIHFRLSRHNITDNKVRVQSQKFILSCSKKKNFFLIHLKFKKKIFFKDKYIFFKILKLLNKTYLNPAHIRTEHSLFVLL